MKKLLLESSNIKQEKGIFYCLIFLCFYCLLILIALLDAKKNCNNFYCPQGCRTTSGKEKFFKSKDALLLHLRKDHPHEFNTNIVITSNNVNMDNIPIENMINFQEQDFFIQDDKKNAVVVDLCDSQLPCIELDDFHNMFSAMVLYDHNTRLT